MKALKFKLSGKTACFRKAEFNSYAYFTYNNIHRVALLGLLGAILGYGGYNQQKKEDDFPEFYARLKNLKISIVPLSDNYGVFPKKIQYFNNSVGYASQEEGGNLVVKEQWLENPCWEIYILDDESQEYNKLKEYILQGKAVYIPYLGKNDHTAQITEATVVDVESSESGFIDSIVIGKNIKYDTDEIKNDDIDGFLAIEYAPVKMDSTYNFAIQEKSIYTNFEYDRSNIDNVYSSGGYNLFFFDSKEDK